MNQILEGSFAHPIAPLKANITISTNHRQTTFIKDSLPLFMAVQTWEHGNMSGLKFYHISTKNRKLYFGIRHVKNMSDTKIFHSNKQIRMIIIMESTTLIIILLEL